MRGGVSKTYTNWNATGSPFVADNGKKYIKVANPKTGTEKEVRWYDDAAHDGMIPKGMKKEEAPKVFKTWGFENETDWAWVVAQKDLTDEEMEAFRFDSNWKACALFGDNYGTKDEWWKGGCWFANKKVMPPEIVNNNAYKKKTWREFVEESIGHTKSEGVFDPNRYWGPILDDLNERGIE